MAYSGRRSTGKTPPVSQDEDSADETLSCEESIFFNEGNGHDGFLVRDGSSIVRIHPSNEHQLSDQCKFRLRVCVDYGWEMQYLPGRLLATHPGNNFVAYILKGKQTKLEVLKICATNYQSVNAIILTKIMSRQCKT